MGNTLDVNDHVYNQIVESVEINAVETQVVQTVETYAQFKKREQRKQQRKYKTKLLKNFKKITNESNIVIQKVYTEDKCNICLDDNCQRYVTLCGHIFHEKCIKEWVNINASCPVCKSVI